MKEQLFNRLLFSATLIFTSGAQCISLSFAIASDSKAQDVRSSSVDKIRFPASTELDKPWSYDPGPDPRSLMGRELIDLVATQPHMPGISMKVSGEQKFRPAFGPTLWRMIQKPNSVKILFIGQDGTHIAEAAGRTATAGFGGRAQDLAAYFGVKNSAAFMNTFAFTIKGQYAAANAPVITKNGQSIEFRSVIDNGTWLMAQDLSSPMVIWRNKLIDWIIRNNKESLKMVVLFGGSAKDSIASFIISKGGQVGTRYTAESLKAGGIKVPRFDLVNAGGNAEWPVVLDQSDRDIVQTLIEKKPDYSDKAMDYSEPEDQKLAMQELKENITTLFADLQIMKGGVGDSGLLHPAQLGGFDLNQISINGKRTLSLKGLRLSDGSSIKNEVLVVDLPHPTYLSNVEMENKGSASKLVAESLQDIEPFVKAGWKIEADPGMVNEFAKGDSYRYGRTDIGPEYYDFGTPKNRMVSKSDAKRMGGKSNVIILGSRESAPFDMTAIEAASKVAPPANLPKDEMFSARPRSKVLRDLFDRGPGEEMAKIMKENLPMELIAKPKAGMDPDEDFLDAYNVKTDPVKVGDFGHYRGTFINPKVIILADPDGVDDILTSRALTGTRGQFLHGLMEDLKIGDQYLVIKTIPFGMEGASDQEWKTILAQTAKYRKAIFQALEKSTSPILIIADGKNAAKEIGGLVGKMKAPIVKINKTGSENSSGIADAAKIIASNPAFKGLSYRGQMANIPRTHLGFFSRVWEGTGGSRVFISLAKQFKDEAFAIVAPEWAFRQTPDQPGEEKVGVESLLQKLDEEQIIRPKELFFDYLQRIKISVLEIWNQLVKAA